MFFHVCCFKFCPPSQPWVFLLVLFLVFFHPPKPPSAGPCCLWAPHSPWLLPPLDAANPQKFYCCCPCRNIRRAQEAGQGFFAWFQNMNLFFIGVNPHAGNYVLHPAILFFITKRLEKHTPFFQHQRFGFNLRTFLFATCSLLYDTF